MLHGASPYTGCFYNPIYVALIAAPLSLVPFDIAYRANAALMFGLYIVALTRLFKRRVLWLALLAPFGLLIAYYGNLDALVMLGVTLPAPVGVWLLLTKPQIGLFAATVMLWKYRNWYMIGAVVAVMGVSLAMGMIHGGISQSWSISLWPWGVVIGMPMLYAALGMRDELLALGAAVFVSPYISALSWCAALPLFRVNRRVMLIGVVLSWVIFGIWRSKL